LKLKTTSTWQLDDEGNERRKGAQGLTVRPLGSS